MRDFPSCFGENGVQIADASSSSSSGAPTSTSTNRNAQNLVTCVYHCKLHTFSFIVTTTWTKNIMGQALSVEIDDSSTQSLCKLEIKPWLFSKRRGSKTLDTRSNSIDVFWDLSNAKFCSSPEPMEGFYLAITVNQELILLLGDMEKEVYKKMNHTITSSPNAVFVSKKEHIFGKKVYATTAQFCDGTLVLQVKRLRWKFRGNCSILIDGLPVEVYWDVYGWFFGNFMGNAVFSFQTCLSAEKLWGGSDRWSSSLDKDSRSQGLGFSLVLCAWKNE
ncbi:hypothetical protein LXL04_001045 [Taraxacum kok-saghyz]